MSTPQPEVAAEFDAALFARHRSLLFTVAYENPRELHQMQAPNGSFRQLVA